MNKNFLILIFFISFLYSCKKEDGQQISSVDFSVSSLMALEEEFHDGRILLQSSETIDGSNLQSNDVIGTFSGVFYDANDEFVAAGLVKVNDNIHLQPVENGKRNLKSGIPCFDLLGRQNDITFTSNNPTFKSFENNIYFPKKLSVRTNIDDAGFLDKAKNLTISWDADAANQDGKIYLTICALGKPCKLVTINDNLGTYTLNSSELDFLQPGDKVFIDVFRGNFKKVTINQKIIVIGAYLNANIASLKVI
jgi:hypothetical protein